MLKVLLIIYFLNSANDCQFLKTLYTLDDVTIMAGMHDGKVVKWKFEETKKVFTVKDAGAVGRDTTQ